MGLLSNFEECVAWYNEWVDVNSFGKPYTEAELKLLADKEEDVFSSIINRNLSIE